MTILKVVSVCDGSVTIRHKLRTFVTGPSQSLDHFFFVFGGVQLSLEVDETSPDPDFSTTPFFSPPTPATPTHPTTLLCSPSQQPTTGEDLHFDRRSSGSRIPAKIVKLARVEVPTIVQLALVDTGAESTGSG